MDISGTIDLVTQPLIEQIEAQRKEIEHLKRKLRMTIDTAKLNIADWNKCEEENKALLGVIDGMKVIIKNLEDERN